MKVLVLFLCTICLFKAFPQAPSSADQNEVSEEERQTFLEAINDLEIEEQLRESATFQSCQEQGNAAGSSNAAKIEAFEECMQGENGVGGIADEDLEELARNLNLSSFNKKAAQSATSIREYLTLRLRKALYGLSPDEEIDNIKNSERNFIDHNTYYQLYAEQIGKNTLLQVSQYCLENIHYGDKTKIIISQKTDVQREGETVKALMVKTSSANLSIANPNDGATALFEYNMPSDQIIDQETSGGGVPALNFLRNNYTSEPQRLKEVEICTLTSQERCKALAISKGATQANAENHFFNINLVKKRKELEFALAKKLGNGDPAEILGNNYEFCAVHVSKNMCDLYK